MFPRFGVKKKVSIFDYFSSSSSEDRSEKKEEQSKKSMRRRRKTHTPERRKAMKDRHDRRRRERQKQRELAHTALVTRPPKVKKKSPVAVRSTSRCADEVLVNPEVKVRRYQMWCERLSRYVARRVLRRKTVPRRVMQAVRNADLSIPNM